MNVPAEVRITAISLANDLRAAARVCRPRAAPAEPSKAPPALLEYEFGHIEAMSLPSEHYWE